jgi:hypothetical protein
MSFPELNRGDKGNEVERLQEWLNRIGAMLKPDGDFGRGTERGVRYAQDIAAQPITGTADTALWEWLEPLDEPFPQLDTDGVAFIALEETGGLGYYDAVTRWPHFPGHSSGITIGVGYDLRFNTEADLRNLWGKHLESSAIDELAKDIGKAGSKKRVSELRRMGIEIPFKAAWHVFIERTLPSYYEQTEGIYPSLGSLPPLCRCALVSIVYNRGSSLSGPRRAEMRAIADILAEADNPAMHKLKRKTILMDVEDEIVAMQRLWGPDSGLYKRRQSEANLWRRGLDAW